MSKPKRLQVGECGQYLRTTDRSNVLTAFRVTGHLDQDCMIISWRNPETGQVVEGSIISAFELVSDEDVATRNPEEWQ